MYISLIARLPKLKLCFLALLAAPQQNLLENANLLFFTFIDNPGICNERWGTQRQYFSIFNIVRKVKI
jgi:hypothetical protein